MIYVVTWFLVKWSLVMSPTPKIYDKFGREALAPSPLSVFPKQDTLFLSQGFSSRADAQTFIKEGTALSETIKKERAKGELDYWLNDKGILVNFKLDSIKIK